jgi:hypothetical protein
MSCWYITTSSYYNIKKNELLQYLGVARFLGEQILQKITLHRWPRCRFIEIGLMIGAKVVIF